MSIKISALTLSSFVGDVRPIWLESDEELKFAPISWSCKGDAILLKTLGGCFHGQIRYGVIVTFIKPGTATVTATLNGESYTCQVTSRERRDFSSETMNYYKGDLHTHTSPEHVHDLFTARTEFLHKEYLEYIKKDNKRDLAVMTDHSETMDTENFFRGFMEYERMKDDLSPIVYPGCENEIMYAEEDRFGRIHRLSGELVGINASSFCQSNTYEEFYYTFKDNPYAIGIFAHPHVIGSSTNGVWDYRPRLNHPKELTSLIKYVEVLNSPGASMNLLGEYVYSEALDAGFRVSTSCGSDQHRNWDFSAFKASTVIMAPEKTREAFTDALLNLRAYASESGNIKLSYTVNGRCAPCDLDEATSYHFAVKLSYFEEDNSTRPVRCDVISDGGMTVKTIEGVDFDSFEFDIDSDSARWFYLRFVDSNTHRTWSPPVFTGRPVIPYVIDDLTPISSEGFKAYDSLGRDASALVDGDSYSEFTAEGKTLSVTVDMGKEYKVQALGNYAKLCDYATLKAHGKNAAYFEAPFPVDYKISVSFDGESFTTVREGVFRAFAGEEIVRFAPALARFVRLEILSTAGARVGRGEYKDASPCLAEITLFE